MSRLHLRRHAVLEARRRGFEAVVERPPTRRDELDLLRALVVVGLVFFHWQIGAPSSAP